MMTKSVHLDETMQRNELKNLCALFIVI